MKEFRFDYLRYPITSTKGKISDYVCRPVISIDLVCGDKTVTFDALIDSGADHCTFPGWAAKKLGHDIFSGTERIFKGIGGTAVSYMHKTIIKLQDVEIDADVFYSHDWDSMPFGLLGQNGFFSVFDVTFSMRDEFVLLKYRD